jgi:hypothetical protein
MLPLLLVFLVFDAPPILPQKKDAGASCHAGRPSPWGSRLDLWRYYRNRSPFA